jgi:hypothetical protein
VIRKGKRSSGVTGVQEFKEEAEIATDEPLLVRSRFVNTTIL